MNLPTKAVVLSTLSLLLGSTLFADPSANGKTSSDRPADADNSARNERDRNNNSITPLDQGKSASDVATTKAIRQEIVGNKALSVTAHNVKIITKDGHVTLRGPVKTSDEKMVIGTIATKLVSADHVDNQLEVKTSTTTDGM